VVERILADSETDIRSKIDAKYKLFRKGQTVVDLVSEESSLDHTLTNFLKGYAPGSWSQVC
jgi:23S rRNA U2552 (ribose-2'-O)-methylase RlmE/FtsJ